MSHPVQALGHFLDAGKPMSFLPTCHWEDPSPRRYLTVGVCVCVCVWGGDSMQFCAQGEKVDFSRILGCIVGNYSSKMSPPIRIVGFHHHSTLSEPSILKDSFSNLSLLGTFAFDSPSDILILQKQNKC